MRSASNMAAMVSSFGCSSLCSSIFTISGIVAAGLDLLGDLCDEFIHFHGSGLALAVTDGDQIRVRILSWRQSLPQAR